MRFRSTPLVELIQHVIPTQRTPNVKFADTVCSSTIYSFILKLYASTDNGYENTKFYEPNRSWSLKWMNICWLWKKMRYKKDYSQTKGWFLNDLPSCPPPLPQTSSSTSRLSFWVCQWSPRLSYKPLITNNFILTPYTPAKRNGLQKRVGINYNFCIGANELEKEPSWKRDN